ncbi:hypothetical protein pneo_cds_370 [Pandoravirus neocaledonia]|uniref:Uncharacterized protein n=1 Tax=Pandoravirus neocaledonia TaxID=2107708 RepID=A0A2U7UBZ1_9VIRU|nr:hypothetical protein pneo_cds_370 [Pandoravirus neocaledonia]AVK75977.1 hypothetical protein pneo_cds_370 [Pandoravirus neocaledonia]
MASALRIIHYVVVTYDDITNKDINPGNSVADCLRSQYALEYVAILEGDIDADDAYDDFLYAVDKCIAWSSASEEDWEEYVANHAGGTRDDYATVVLSDAVLQEDPWRFDVDNTAQANAHFQGVDVVCRVFTLE